MKTKFILALSYSCLLSGCGSVAQSFINGVNESMYGKRPNLPTKAQLDSDVKRSIGMDELTLVQQGGPPEKTYSVGDHKFIEYQYSYNMNTPSTIRANSRNGSIVGGVYGGGVTNYSCKIIFEIVNGKVSNTTYDGNGCTSD
ncbi:TPA: hypothetical protein MAM15_005377 [Klebsiella pneumoniae]|nr:hypothetical protein [Klebsiella pneumoniae]